MGERRAAAIAARAHLEARCRARDPARRLQHRVQSRKAGRASRSRPAGEGEGSATVFLPEVHAGCVVEIGFRQRELLDSALPEVSDAVDIQREVPALSTQIEVRVPEKKPFRVVLKNSAATATETTEDERRVYRWKLGPLPAAEPLAGDPPAHVWTAWLGISSLQSWDDFAAWFRRISAGSDVADESVSKAAADLVADAKTRREKIKRVFEFVSALRYEAVEIGIQGFRPRTPAQVLANRYGDCKDKANLIAAMLKSLGIDARFALVYRGGVTDVDFRAGSSTTQSASCRNPATATATSGSIPPRDSPRSGSCHRATWGGTRWYSARRRAGFKKIAQDDAGMSTLSDEWELRQTDAAWTGTFSRKATGLAEYEMRAIFTGLSPMQRQEKIHETLSRLWPQADFGKASVSNTSDLQKPVGMDAEFDVPSGDLAALPSPGVCVAQFVRHAGARPAALDRRRPEIRQRADAAIALRAPDDRDEGDGGIPRIVGGQMVAHHRVEGPRRPDSPAHGRAEILQPQFTPEEYQAFRASLRKWIAALSK